MFDSVKGLERKIASILKEISKHENKRANAKSPADAKIYSIRKDAALDELSRLRGKLVLAITKEKLKNKNK